MTAIAPPISDNEMIDWLESKGFIVCHKDVADHLATFISDDAVVTEVNQRSLIKQIEVDIETALDIVEQAGYNVNYKDDCKDLLWDLYDAKIHGTLDKKLHDLFVEYLNTWL